MLTHLACTDKFPLVMSNQDVISINVDMTYDEMWAVLIKAPKDNRYISVIGSDEIEGLARHNIARALCARCDRQQLPYKLHAVRTKLLKFWWEERNVPHNATPIEKLQHNLNRDRFDIDVKLGIHPALMK